MSASQEKLYRTVSALFCAAFAVVGALFLFVPRWLCALFNDWSAEVGLATFAGDGGGFFVGLAVAYMYVVTVLAWEMFREPLDPRPPRLLLHAKGASSILSFGLFSLATPHLAFLANGVVDGALWVVILLLVRMASPVRAERAT